MKQYPAIERESQMPVMEELTRQIKPILGESRTKDEKEAFEIVMGTLFRLASDIFSYLPPEEQSHILTACGTWFSVGLLVGKAPGKLVDILQKVNPVLEDIELPDWLWSSYPLSVSWTS